MSTATLGLYEFYWFYQNWKLVKLRTGRDILPFWRTVFALFFCDSLFKDVARTAEAHRVPPAFNPDLIALAWIVLGICHRLPDPYWLICFLSPLALLPVQRTANDLNSSVSPGHERNDGFSAWNIAGMAGGGLLFVSIVIGAFLPE